MGVDAAGVGTLDPPARVGQCRGVRSRQRRRRPHGSGRRLAASRADTEPTTADSDRQGHHGFVVPAHRMLAGRYRLDRVIGSGAMGIVWAAYDEVLHRAVAIKEVNYPQGMPIAEVGEQLADRTLREARAIAAMSNPHVITLYDILTLESGPVIVMELLTARSLAQVLRQDGPLRDGQAATIGVAVAGGLLAAHGAGITHRDVKPGNVLIGHDGRIKLTDFGIARSADEQTITAKGLLLGSPAASHRKWRPDTPPAITLMPGVWARCCSPPYRAGRPTTGATRSRLSRRWSATRFPRTRRPVGSAG